jgi:hypothetical protein
MKAVLLHRENLKKSLYRIYDPPLETVEDLMFDSRL